ncbi:MAG: hypothetical protein M3R08_06315 [Bacteroidota bacterium]|nr:hypothetical protein [Bacteroidota bacterium]
MAKDRGFRKMRDLIMALADAERNMEVGGLSHEGLEQACLNARDLYERLIVLRHKAREAQLSGRTAWVKKEEAQSSMSAEMKVIEDLSKVNEPPPMKLDTRPQEISPRQTSLIEAIEASTEPGEKPRPAEQPKPAQKIAAPQTVQEEKKAPPIKRPETTPSLAEKMNKASIPSLAKAITLSHKFWFVSELFNGDRIAYEKTIMALDAMHDRALAESHLRTEVIEKLKKPADPTAVATLMELIERRFP